MLAAPAEQAHYLGMLIPESDPDIEAGPVEIYRDGSAMPGYYAAPRAGAATTPTIVLAMHLWGVNSEQRNTARRFAKNGFAIVVPDLYARFDAPDGDEEKDPAKFVPPARSLSPQTVEPDIAAATAWIKERFPESKTAIADFAWAEQWRSIGQWGGGDVLGSSNLVRLFRRRRWAAG
ncbi:MAG: dienelactone hydrolase family protein [Candidatus Eremiobacteraeota bacterium]|nr:dienelactone hydrolase family protein [Candidatus Eremiobacteraeota bacterium]